MAAPGDFARKQRMIAVLRMVYATIIQLTMLQSPSAPRFRYGVVFYFLTSFRSLLALN